MKKSEILELEQTNDDHIHLFREGTFWIAYERSAHRFATTVRPYTAKKKFIQNIGCEMVSLGFPDTALAALELPIVEKTENRITLRAPVGTTPQELETWKAGLESFVPKSRRPAPPSAPVIPLVSEKPQADPLSIIDRLRDFNLESKTPMECMNFVSDLKKSLRHAL